MSGGGRPLRFIAIVLTVWIGARVYLLWPQAPVAARRVPIAATVTPRPVAVMVATAIERHPTDRDDARGEAVARFVQADPVRPRTGTLPPPPPAPTTGMTAGIATAVAPIPIPIATVPVATAAPVVNDAPPPATRRWSASGWAIVRAAGSEADVATPQLGGDQAGIRIARTLDRDGRFAIAARIAGALGTRQREGAIGVEWRPSRWPVRIVVERRIGIAGLRGGDAVGLIGGIGTRAPAGIRVDGYAQAGAIVRDGTSGYADGAIRATRAIWQDDTGMMLEIGVGAWGAAQRDAHRLDIGPAAAMVLPVGGAPRLRVAAAWRQRVIGDARPGSGPALSIGADY